jgi:hypothetical protein
MNTETLKISLVQRILSMRNNRLLQKINDLINSEDIVTYDSYGNALTEREYKRQLDEVIDEMESGKDKGLTTDEVFNNIKNAYHLE